MAKTTKLGRDGQTVNIPQADGSEISIQNTPAGPRAHRHLPDGRTESVDLATLGVARVSVSTVGGNSRRLTVKKPDGTASDFTRRQDGTVDETSHDGNTSKPGR